MRRTKSAYPLIGKSGERTEDEYILNPFQTSGRQIRFHHCSQFIPIQEGRGSLLLHAQLSQFLQKLAMFHPALLLSHLENLTETLQIFGYCIPGQPAGFLQIPFKCRDELPVQFGECDILLIIDIPYDCLHQFAAPVVTCQGGRMQIPGRSRPSVYTFLHTLQNQMSFFPGIQNIQNLLRSQFFPIIHGIPVDDIYSVLQCLKVHVQFPRTSVFSFTTHPCIVP